MRLSILALSLVASSVMGHSMVVPNKSDRVSLKDEVITLRVSNLTVKYPVDYILSINGVTLGKIRKVGYQSTVVVKVKLTGDQDEKKKICTTSVPSSTQETVSQGMYISTRVCTSIDYFNR